MLLLLFHAGNDLYGIDTRSVIEVLPLLKFKNIPGTPDYVSGLIDYRGLAVPVLDATALITGELSCLFFSSRIVIIDYPQTDGQHYHLGLLAEKVTETIPYEENKLQHAGVSTDKANYLGDIMLDERGIIQRVTIENLLPHDLGVRLFNTEPDNRSG